MVLVITAERQKANACMLIMMLLLSTRRLVLLFAFLQKTTQNVSAVLILSLQTLPADHIWRNEQKVSKRLQQYPVFDSPLLQVAD